MGYFEMISLAQAGIREDAIDRFLQLTEASGVELHRLMILRHGKCCTKIVWSPYSEGDLHPLYSFSKSITATAIGFAVQEGILSLDDRIMDFFPEELPENPSENLKLCTIHHLLSMSGGHETEPQDKGPDWIRSFFAHPFLHAPGTFFRYNTAGTNILAAILRKKTGQQVTEYLRDRLFDPLGIGEVSCWQLPDALHTQHGGGGMKMCLEDMAKFTQFMLQDGVWEGKTLLKDWYLARAGQKKIETAHDSEGHVKEWALGYGYQCWMCSLPGSFRADGAFGQFGLVYPTLDLCIIMNAATEQTQSIIDAVNLCILPGVTEESSVLAHVECSGSTQTGSTQTGSAQTGPAQPGSDQSGPDHSGPNHAAVIKTLSLPVLTSSRNPVVQDELRSKVFIPESTGQMAGLQTLVGGSGNMDFGAPASIEKLRFDFKENQLDLYITENGVEKKMMAGLNHRFALSEIDHVRYAACARWRSLCKLELEIRRLDALSGVRLILSFTEDNRLHMEADDTLMTYGGLGIVDRPLTDFKVM